MAHAQIDAFGKALDQYRLDVGHYPSTEQGLQALMTAPAGVSQWSGPYLKKAVPADPWGKPYQYRQPGEHGEYDILSFGADGQPGGEGPAADIGTGEALRRMRYRVKAVGADAAVVETELDAGSAPRRGRCCGAGLAVLSLRSVALRRGSRFPLQLFNQELPRCCMPAFRSRRCRRWPRRSTVARCGWFCRIFDSAARGQNPVERARSSRRPFDLYVATIRAAERTSDLDRALARYIAYQQQIDTLRGKLVSASIYPVLLLGVGGLVVLFLLGYVVPRFSHIYEDMGGDMPFLSRLLLDWGRLVEANAVLLGVALLVAIAAVVLAARWRRCGRQWGARCGACRWWARACASSSSRFYRTLGMLSWASPRCRRWAWCRACCRRCCVTARHRDRPHPRRPRHRDAGRMRADHAGGAPHATWASAPATWADADALGRIPRGTDRARSRGG